MAFVNCATKNLAIKIVYYGPGLSGKTTNLRYIYFKLDSGFRGDFICLETETERTFFFDILPIKAGLIGEFRVHFQLMTVPGQVTPFQLTKIKMKSQKEIEEERPKIADRTWTGIPSAILGVIQ